MSYKGKCNCGAIEWTVVGKVDFTASCHCTVCQTNCGSAYGSTSLMIYDPKGVEFKGAPRVFKGKSDAGNSTQRGFCADCGSVLFSHVSKGQPDEHWAVRTGGMIGESPKPDKEIFMKSKPGWAPTCQTPENQSNTMPES